MSIKEFIYFNKNRIIIISSVIVIFLLGISHFFYYKYFKNETLEEVNDIPISLEKNEEKVSVMCFFDIKGEVQNPGVHSIECDLRIDDAIKKSGGLTKNSDTSVLNLSKKIEDGMVIIVYSKNEVLDYLKTLEKEEKKQSICSSSNIKNDACINSSNISISNSNTSLININTASLSTLMTLSGIGETKAKNIILYREKTPFKKIEDILNVDGIGENIYVNIKENITV